MTNNESLRGKEGRTIPTLVQLIEDVRARKLSEAFQKVAETKPRSAVVQAMNDKLALITTYMDMEMMVVSRLGWDAFKREMNAWLEEVGIKVGQEAEDRAKVLEQTVNWIEDRVK